MDAGSRRPQLPALSYLDVDKVKREEEVYQNRHTGAPPQSLPPVTVASPTFLYPPGPPPPYSQPPPNSAPRTNTWTTVQSIVNTPPESRRTSGDEQDAKQRQSLPSISEALGVDSQTPYHSTTHAPSHPSVSAHQSHPQPAIVPVSPISASARRYGMEPAVTQHHTANGSFPPFSQSSAHSSDRPPLHLQTAQSMPPPPPHQSAYSYPTHLSPSLEQQSSSTGSMGPPNLPYGYTPYPPRYAQPTPPSSGTSGPIYQPSANYPAPSTPSTSWRSDTSTKFVPTVSATEPGDYSASVKRHLDLYDLEGALNEISQSSGILTDFSRRYGDRLHQTARTGTPLTSLPGMVEVNDMISKSRSQVEALLKIREVILAQQAAYDQQLAEQRPSKHIPEPAPIGQDQLSDAEDTTVGFAGSEMKKRRGRAAPPGRCHSCNRAETPEWRRGPDGARTLCNACGLHYAKLTRKQQGANKASGAGSSNLRPKET